MAEPRYQPRKFKELLVYVAAKSRDDPKLGDMKLNKLLYFADVTAFRQRGKPITGARYTHHVHGPLARPLVPARKELVRNDRLKVETRKYYGRDQTYTEAIDQPDPDLFDEGELAIVDEIIEKFKDFDGTDMEDVTHQEPGWQMTSDGEVIPYRATLVARTASPRAVQRGKELAKRFGW
jgi:uncharacterized phage-associated protein